METRQMWHMDAEQQQQPQTQVVAPPAANRMLYPQQSQGVMPQPNPAPADEQGTGMPVLAGLPFWMLAVAIFAGAVVALFTIPTWVPVLGRSLLGAEPTVYWYLSRASAFVAFGLLWVSMVSGLFITNKMARVWPGVFTAFDLHQYTSLLGLGFAVFHVVVLLGNLYLPYSVAQLLIPIVDAPYRPLWVALGQIGLYLSVLVTFTFYVRKQIGNRTWHLIHLLSYGVFAMSLLHGLLSGTDSSNLWVVAMYWASGVSLLGFTIHRMTMRKAVPVRQ
ncbi:MAG: hypothetical protein ABI670_18270 [Chloroflexota bacterium]